MLLDIPLPLTVVLILSIDLGTDLLPALGLGAERPESDVMRKQPRSRGDRLLSRNLLLMSYGIVGMIQAAAGFFSYFVILHAGGWEWGQELAGDDQLYRTAVTGFFASIIICQVADVMICRTRRQSLLTVGLLSNRLVLVGIGTELLLLALISYVPGVQRLLRDRSPRTLAARAESSVRRVHPVRRRAPPLLRAARESVRPDLADMVTSWRGLRGEGVRLRPKPSTAQSQAAARPIGVPQPDTARGLKELCDRAVSSGVPRPDASDCRGRRGSACADIPQPWPIICCWLIGFEPDGCRPRPVRSPITDGLASSGGESSKGATP